MDFDLKIKEIEKIIENSKKPILFYDSDTDGFTSYLQLKKRWSKILGFSLSKNFAKQKYEVEKIDFDNDLVLFVDIPFLSDDFLEKIVDKVRFSNIVWIDHHNLENREVIKKYDICYFNPLDFNLKDNRACSYLCYLIANLKENLFFAVLGSVSDFFLLDIILEFYKEDKKGFEKLLNIKGDFREELFDFLRKYSFSDKRVLKRRNFYIRYLIYETNLKEIRNLIDFVFKLKNSCDIEKSLNFIEECNFYNILEDINSKKGFVFENYANLKVEYDKLFSRVDFLSLKKDFYIFKYCSKYPFTKTLCEEINYKLDYLKVVGVCATDVDKDYYLCSFRGNNFDVLKMIKSVSKNIRASGGGHKFAVGARVKKEDFDVFVRNIKNYIENF